MGAKVIVELDFPNFWLKGWGIKKMGLILKEGKMPYAIETQIKSLSIEKLFLLRREGSNLRPSGYEPDELPLLYFAMWGANIQAPIFPAKQFLIV